MAVLYLVAAGWGYVVVLMTVAEATAPNGSVLGALATLFFYGVLPLGIVLYLLATPTRRRAQARREAAASGVVVADPDRGRHAAGDPVAPEREEA